MNAQTAGYLLIFGIFTILLGVIGFQTHPDNAPAPLIVGGGFGALLVLWGILGARGARWSMLPAVLSVVSLALACVWRGSLGWLAVARGQGERTFASLVVTLMLVVAVFLLCLLMRDRKAGDVDQPAEDAP